MQKYLLRYRYGSGSLWAFVIAESEHQIYSKFRDIEIYSETPDWLDADLEAVIQTHRIEKPAGWLPLVLKKGAPAE